MDETSMTTQGQDGPITASFGARLKTARETLRMSQKEAAARLHLNSNVIGIMEKDIFEHSLPPTFMRGYLRSYARLLKFDEHDISIAIDKFNASLLPSEPAPTQPNAQKNEQPLKLDQYLRWSSYAVISVLFVLVLVWWASHPRYNEIDVMAKQLAPTTTTIVSNTTTTPQVGLQAPTLPNNTAPIASNTSANTAPNTTQQPLATALNNATISSTVKKILPAAPTTQADDDSNDSEPELDSANQEDVY